jgi:hypothetical protein
MADSAPLQLWDLWYPHAAATGLPFARGRLEATDTLLVHAPPASLAVEVRSVDGVRLAFGQDLAQTADRPMARLARHGNRVQREDIWPTEHDLGALVILPGGEVGVLRQWWNAADGSQWRWQIELYNHR